MPNKKTGRNAYFFFALDMIPELRRRGLQVSGVREAISLCSEDWALLTAEQKEAYAEKARLLKNDPDSTGHVIEGVLGPRKIRERDASKSSDSSSIGFFQLHDQYNSATQWTLPTMNIDTTINKNKALDQHVFYFINIFSHGDMPTLCDQRYVPCEIACVRYSLREGILGSFHDFIDPGELPHGFRYHCQSGSASTHHIPISGFELANSDYHNMFRKFCSFVCPTPSIRVPVYTKANDIYRVDWCLQWLANKAGMENHFQVHEVEGLIIKFYQDKLKEEPSRPSVSRLLDTVQWDYSSNTRCKWHEDNDMWCCVLASCKKIAYCISKALASVYGVTLTPAHLPNLELSRNQNSGNPKVVVLDAKRFQKVCSSDPKYSSDKSERSSVEPRGVKRYQGPSGGGRGILRLLETLAASQNSGE
ncbi:protein maelstrom homolog isoform X1 [Xenopus laevis]|uniref:Protein maelstrom homolog n=1 Tax=Xenopus laevis TaxID=8355 RepID=A0A8J0UFZ4_XENLA|nr:protein maelstrom homolog isoform X1 [Xenopus laevis]